MMNKVDQEKIIKLITRAYNKFKGDPNADGKVFDKVKEELMYHQRNDYELI